MSKKKVLARLKIKRRVRGKLSGTSDRPRLSVFRSNKQIYAQIIDDSNGRTLASASSLTKEGTNSQPKLEQASTVGTMIAEQAKSAGVSNVVFDRNGYLFHGRVKQLANAAREGGLKF
ncbi:MAG: 50S ribosomal protein L18 [Bacteroidetes bacterium]|jgi:large subunit ribosomal protein L18|nr:50S ribosomal protein L18 [Bacteroidota bacterium]MDA0569002.1 50S ribosomal protein L18 [Bacteroidota bacterium]